MTILKFVIREEVDISHECSYHQNNLLSVIEIYNEYENIREDLKRVQDKTCHEQLIHEASDGLDI